MATTTTPLLTALLKKSTLDDHDELLKASNAALKKSKTDVEAQYIKTIAFIKLDKYDDAVQFVEDCGAGLKARAALEYAYALYKVGRLEEAAKVASQVKSRGGKHVEAQASYRLENTARTTELYKEIRQEPDSAEDFDLRVNQGAIDAQAQWLGQDDSASVRRPGREDLEAFETAYNAACGSIARGELAQAEMLLKRARELCKHSEDLTDEQKSDELLPIAVQQLFILQSLGKTSEADALAKEISVDAISDYSTRSIASSNLLLASPNISNPFLAHKTFNATPKVPQSDKLFSYQSIPFASNEKTIALRTFKFDGIATSTSRLLSSQQTTPTVSPELLVSSVFNAAAHARNDVSKSAIKKVLPELSKRPNDVGLIVTLVQMYVLTGNPTSAIELMETFFKRLDESIAENEQDLRFNPGLVSILVGLYRRQGRKIHVKQELAKAASYWRHKSKAPASLLRAAGSSLLETSSPEDSKTAADIFAKLREQQPAGDKATIAGFVASHAWLGDEDKGELATEAAKLTSIADLTRNIDVDQLEQAGIPQSTNALAIAQSTRSRKRARASAADAAGAADTNIKAAKRIRTSRLPKDYDPSKKADPERWLPLKDRSTYRPPKGKKKNKKAGGDASTQGGAVNEDLNIDSKPAANTAAGGGGKKKKGKGKK